MLLNFELEHFILNSSHHLHNIYDNFIFSMDDDVIIEMNLFLLISNNYQRQIKRDCYLMKFYFKEAIDLCPLNSNKYVFDKEIRRIKKNKERLKKIFKVEVKIKDIFSTQV
jgi:hypothetical protein